MAVPKETINIHRIIHSSTTADPMTLYNGLTNVALIFRVVSPDHGSVPKLIWTNINDNRFHLCSKNNTKKL